MRQAPPITATMAGQVYSAHEHSLEKRVMYPRPIKSLAHVDVLTCHLPQALYGEVPQYPGATDITIMENKVHKTPEEVALLANFPRWYIGRQDDNGVPYLTKVDTRQLGNSGPGGQQVFVGNHGKPQASIDHICMFTSTCYTDFPLY
jgi:hypothetical protein